VVKRLIVRRVSRIGLYRPVQRLSLQDIYSGK
jgi:hypothetical protein